MLNKNSPDEVECNEIKVKGVYEPAINIYIAQWSNFWKIFSIYYFWYHDISLMKNTLELMINWK